MRVRSLALAVLALLFLWVGVYRILYPFPYGEDIQVAAEESGLSPAVILAVIRTESGFRREVVSRSGAVGLMQLMPSTAEEVALRHGLPAPHGGQLFMPRVNILLGSLYLADLLERYGGSLPMALAAYNAGHQRVQGWVAEGLWDGTWETVGSIPYGETRQFLQKVRRSMVIYRWLYRIPEDPR